jgi:hypothetical protein
MKTFEEAVRELDFFADASDEWMAGASSNHDTYVLSEDFKAIVHHLGEKAIEEPEAIKAWIAVALHIGIDIGLAMNRPDFPQRADTPGRHEANEPPTKTPE